MTAITDSRCAAPSGGGVAALHHLPALDGLRGIAAITVVLNHAGVRVPLYGVEVFFVLSGFLITRLLIAELHRTGGVDLRRFYTRRAYRLLPAFGVLLLVVPIMLAGTAWAVTAQDVAVSGTYLANLSRAAGHDVGALGHTWSLAAEEQFYVLWPMVLALVVWRLPSRNRHRVVALAAVTVVVWRGWLYANGADWARIYNGFDTHADAILAGCALALWPQLPRWCASWLVLPAGLGLSVLAGREANGALCMTLGAAASLLLVGYVLGHGHGLVGRVLSLRPARYLGAISYGLYLWHYPLQHALGVDAHPGRVWVHVPAALVLAACSYRWVEQPMLALRDRRTSARPRATVLDLVPA